jgi:hypothetical protein
LPINNTTSNFGWQLPDASNTLSYDVLRIIAALNAADSAVAARPTTAVVDTKIATAISNLVASSPAALDTLNELATALGNDANFATTMTNALAGKLGLAGGILTGLLTLAAAGLQLASGAEPDVDGKLTLVSGMLHYARGGTVYELVDNGAAQTLTNKTFTNPTINTPTINTPTVNGAAAASTIKDATGANQQIGYLGVPAVAAKTAPYTLDLPDAFLEIPTNSAITIPANTAKAFAVGTMIGIRNTSSAGIAISITTDTLTQEGTTNTGTRTLAGNGVALLKKITATSWLIMGGSVT